MNLALSAALLGGAIIDLDGTFFLQLGIFLAIFAMLNWLVFRPMLALMDARETATDGAKHSARELETEAAEKLHAFETQMTAAKAELAIERERLRKDGQSLERELVSTARAEADAMLKDAAATIAEESAKVRGDIKVTVPVLAGQIAEKLLGRKAS
jgi:F-type H+-transporting ATPase subunit b